MPSSIQEPKLIQRPKRRSGTPKRSNSNVVAARGGRITRPAAAPVAVTPQHYDPDNSMTVEDAAEGTDAFKNRVTEITSFKVFSRVRPFIMEELAEMQGQPRRSIVEMTGSKTILLDPKENWAPKAQFEFDASLWSIPPSHNLVHTFQDTRRTDYATQLDVYNMIAKDLVPHVFNGFNSCVLTYGQTGSGKTYTMMGKYDPHASCGGDGEEGIIPRVSNDLFMILAERRLSEESMEPAARANYRVEVSFVEIYMERVRDLLDPALRNSRGNEKLQDARIRQDPYSGPFVEGVTKYQVENWAQCCNLLERGSQHRTTCATAVHNQSSRSHAIFQLTVIQERTTPAKDRYSRPVTKTQAGRINLVDLAGSERGGFQEYVKESAAINTSLLALRRVIDNLTERQNMLMEQVRAELTGAYHADKPLPQVPFRDSVLTWLLSDSIGGNARTTMVATLSPLVKNYGDTFATLQWSSKARNLVTLVKMNEQSVVQGGMAQQAGQLNNAVRIQRQNLDSLRETLNIKQSRAASLAKDTKSIRSQVEKLKQRHTAILKDRAALVAQRSYHDHTVQKKLVSYEKHKEKLQREAKANDQSSALIASTRKMAEDKENDAIGRLQRARKTLEQLKGQHAMNTKTREAFEQRMQDAKTEHDRICSALHADDLCREHVAQKETEVQTVAAKVIAQKKAVENQEAELTAMRQAIAASEMPEWETKLQDAMANISDWKRRRDEMKHERNVLLTERNALRARHTKVCGKS